MAVDRFVRHPTVQRFLSTLDDLTPEEQAGRIAVLQAYADFVGQTPDQMIDDVFDQERRKYRKRNYYTTKVKEFAATYGDSANAQLRRANVIRAFFIANGRRLIPERPAWMSD